MAGDAIRVLGVDTSLRSTGVAVLEAKGNSIVPVEYFTIASAASVPVTGCLRKLHIEISELIARAKPSQAAIEGIFFCKNVKTSVSLGQARGVVLAALALAGVPTYEYAPRRVKQAVVGYGAASKEQVQHMIATILSLDRQPAEDEGDALAIAVCHLHNAVKHELLAPKPI